MAVVRTVHRSERTSIEYATADYVPAIVLQRMDCHRASALPALCQPQKEGTSLSRTGEQNPLKKQKSGVLPPLSCVGSLFEFKRSVFRLFGLYSADTIDAVFISDDYQFSHFQTLTGSFLARLRLPLGFSASGSASACSAVVACASFASAFAFSVIIGITTTR